MATGDVDFVMQAVSERLERFCRAVKIEAFSGTIMDTRVKTGRLRGNWQTNAAAPASGELDRLSPSGSESIGEVRQNAKADDVTYLTNNLPYASVWEDEDGMIRRNATRILANLERYIER